MVEYDKVSPEEAWEYIGQYDFLLVPMGTQSRSVVHIPDADNDADAMCHTSTPDMLNQKSPEVYPDGHFRVCKHCRARLHDLKVNQ